MTRTLAGVCALAATITLASAPADASGKLPDGRWFLQIEGQGPHFFCWFNISGVGEVRRGKPVYKGPAKYQFTVSRGGVLSASGRTADDYGSVRGKVTRTEATGVFEVPTRNCRGNWRARRIGG